MSGNGYYTDHALMYKGALTATDVDSPAANTSYCGIYENVFYTIHNYAGYVYETKVGLYTNGLQYRRRAGSSATWGDWVPMVTPSDIATQNIKSNLTIGEKVQSNSQILQSGNVVYFSLNLTSVSEGDILVSNLGSYSPRYKCIGCVFKATDGKPIAGSVWAEESTSKLTYYGDTYNATCYCSIVYIKA